MGGEPFGNSNIEKVASGAFRDIHTYRVYGEFWDIPHPKNAETLYIQRRYLGAPELRRIGG